MSYHANIEPTRFGLSMEQSSPEKTIVKALPMLVPETILHQAAERKRIKKGMLDESDENNVFSKTLYLPYLEFTYQYLAEKGLFSKRTVQARGRSIILALREVDLDFYPELAALRPLMIEIRSGTGSIVEGVDSTVLPRERLEELKVMLSNYDNQLLDLAKQYDSMVQNDPLREEIKDNIDHLKETRETRWKMFADGLSLPSRVDLDTIEFLEGSLFYMPYFIVRLARSGESRFLVWDREGKPNEPLAEELMKNGRFRDLVLSHV